MTFEYKKLLLLKSPENKVASKLRPLKKNKTNMPYMHWALWDKVIDFTDEPVVQCDVAAVKNTSLDDDDDNDERK